LWGRRPAAGPGLVAFHLSGFLPGAARLMAGGVIVDGEGWARCRCSSTGSDVGGWGGGFGGCGVGGLVRGSCGRVGMVRGCVASLSFPPEVPPLALVAQNGLWGGLGPRPGG